MTRLRLKLVLTLLALVVFYVGVRNDDPKMRWVAIGLLGAAFLTRFIPRKPTDS